MRESEWPERIRRGDRDAFELMFRAYYPRLCTFVERYADLPETAEELVQDLFVSIWEKRAQWTVRGSLAAYLFGAARNRAFDHLKHRRVRRRLLDHGSGAVPGMAEAGPAVDDRMHSETVARAVDDAIQQLPERARLAVVLRWQQQMTYAEIAAVMEVSVKGVENQLGRAVKVLRERLAHLRA
ncbi:MAG TPA: RNA polymerase sigma-70 factor [Longimicrobium sp.]|jgi:RNA polymerase sigma-70 factor (ECF subfamily)|uniref:RNA polymerase sigma-70 factor n=1 Tax=Longimicrobium sp. TaxID=2029185 RepID=UPI002EDB9E27